MIGRICIIGSGPTGIFTLKNLITSAIPLFINVYEAEQNAGKGTPYLPGANDPVMLSNIPSIEIPMLGETLVDWLNHQSDEYLDQFSIVRTKINEREFYPRLVLGDYFQDQFTAILTNGRNRGHAIEVYSGHRVTDIALGADDIRLIVGGPDGEFDAVFDHVVMATGHSWPAQTEVQPGYFSSPWPAAALRSAGHGRLGVLGTSLSGIDALLTVASSRGSFVLDAAGDLQFQPASGGDNFCAAMMSRKGLLPEADFYCPLPYRTPLVCTKQAIDAEIESGSVQLLDRVFDLFRKEITAADPDYAAEIGLSLLTVDTFAEAYYGRRSNIDPFVWAAANLAEAERNYERQFTIPWRYAILITHEIIERAIPHLDANDLQRFNRSFKSIFVDEYATVPHLSIKRLLALRNAGRLEIVRLDENYEIETDDLARGARVVMGEQVEIFDSFIDATGQTALSAQDLPFPTLLQQRGVKKAPTSAPVDLIREDDTAAIMRTGGIDVDEKYRPVKTAPLTNQLYCVAIPFLLHARPFVQGITSAAELGETAANAILKHIADAKSPLLMSA
ncbi:putative NAD(P)/FAD-binding protein YdhS [Neorhizobium huautlense]|uniref:NAD(P)/FAD-binding protein YdhS n=1 Tax=Neorhizobium huautlense TaxID=67774 RepID=A0ABT9Q0R3_9HYPH|nr:FAD/NAD(P)-binding protein [Neorhizobium huautlense]MDP9839928.1 putative NAD(P)/FAD-binding protein YdhS [Neorhizobium huautlense]